MFTTEVIPVQRRIYFYSEWNLFLFRKELIHIQSGTYPCSERNLFMFRAELISIHSVNTTAVNVYASNK